VFLIVGLGNPTSRYRNTRHNLGFMVLDSLAGKWEKQFRKGKGHYKLIKTAVGSQRVILAKPTTYMNRSGVAVYELVNKYDVKLFNLLVLCDDLSLPLGKLRLRKKGSAGGHKGLTSIIAALGSEEFPRLRFGVGYNPLIDASEYVLSPFLPIERKLVNSMIKRGGKAVIDFIDRGIEWTMNFYNG